MHLKLKQCDMSIMSQKLKIKILKIKDKKYTSLEHTNGVLCILPNSLRYCISSVLRKTLVHIVTFLKLGYVLLSKNILIAPGQAAVMIVGIASAFVNVVITV